MITIEQAEELVLKQLDVVARNVRGGVDLIRERTIVLPYGWVFFYNSRTFLETGDPFEALGGNAPVLVEAANGKLTELGTSQPIAEYLRALEASRGWG